MTVARLGAFGRSPSSSTASLHRIVCATASVIIPLLSPCTPAAQIVQPDQRIATPAPFQGMPQLSAVGKRVFATWCGNAAFNTGVGYCYSSDGGSSWTNETGLPVAAPFNGVGSPSVQCLMPDGTVHLVTDNLGMQYFHGSGALPITWSNPAIALNIYVHSFAGYDVPSLGCDPSTGYVYLTATEGIEDSENTSNIIFTRSLDNGSTWQPPIRISSPSSRGPSLVVGPDGTVYVTWVDYALGHVLISRSTDHGATFQPPVPVSDILDNLAARPIGWQDRGIILAARGYPYYKAGSFQFAPNFPALAVDRSSGPHRGSLYATWAEYAAGTISPATSVVTDQGNNDTFATAQPVPLDSDISGFLPSVEFGLGEDDYYVFSGTAGQTVWISGSATNGGTGSGLYMELPDSTKLFVGTQSLFDPNDVPQVGVPKPAIFTLPRTGRYYLWLPSQSTLDVTYTVQLRTYIPSANSVARDMRDIVLVRSTDGGATWSPKLRVNQDPPGADQAMPNVAVDGLGRLFVGWYDRRDAANGDSVNAYATASVDGGRTFGPDMRLSSRGSAWVGAADPISTVVPGDLIGDRVAIAAGDDYAIVAWADMRDWPGSLNPPHADIYAARIVDIPTAVEAVSDLVAEPAAEGVRLTWLVNDAHGIAGMRLYRADEGEPERALGATDILATGAGHLDFLDATAEPGRTYAYRLQIRSSTGTWWLGPAAVQVPSRITALAWRAAWPNPFARRTTVKLAVPGAAEGAVRVYDVQGKEIRTLAQGRFEPGEHAIEWDGRDASGAMAAAGIYFVAARVGAENVRLRVARVP